MQMGTDSTAETWQTTWPSVELNTNSAADNSKQDVISNHIAADTIQTSVLHSFLDTDARIIRLLLSETNITVRVDDTLSAPFNTTVGTQQGDSLSPVLFIVHLEVALRTLCGSLPC